MVCWKIKSAICCEIDQHLMKRFFHPTSLDENLHGCKMHSSKAGNVTVFYYFTSSSRILPRWVHKARSKNDASLVKKTFMQQSRHTDTVQTRQTLIGTITSAELLECYKNRKCLREKKHPHSGRLVYHMTAWINIFLEDICQTIPDL